MTNTTTDYVWPLPNFGAIMTVADFANSVRCGAFTDDDGYANPVREGLTADTMVLPSNFMVTIPKDATHVVWFNK